MTSLRSRWPWRGCHPSLPDAADDLKRLFLATTFAPRLPRLDNIHLRVEPGEIESVLQSLPGIEDAAISALKVNTDGGMTTELVAYVVISRPRSPAVRTIRERLANILPRYKVPAYFVHIHALPRLSSGKIDKRALPDFMPATRKDFNIVAER